MSDGPDKEFDVLPGAELVAKHGLSLDGKPLNLRKEDVPASLHHLTELATFWGITDDVLRYKFVQAAPKEALETLKKEVRKVEDELDRWLGGPEADGDSFSDAYTAFSCMRLAADEA